MAPFRTPRFTEAASLSYADLTCRRLSDPQKREKMLSDHRRVFRADGAPARGTPSTPRTLVIK